MKEVNLVFWFDQPPKVGKGCFNYITKVWPGKVIYAYTHGFSEIRKSVNWDDGDYGDAVMIDLSQDTAKKVEEIFNTNDGAVHIVGGFKSRVIQYLDKYIFSNKYNFVCFSERPGVYGKWWKRLIKRVYVPVSEKMIAKKYQPYFKAYLPLGRLGVDENKEYGWQDEKLYPFMYDPVDCVTDKNIYSVKEPMKFLYVGRFSRYTKGTDTLVKALDLVTSDKNLYSIDFVGGYGDMKDEVISWTQRNENAAFLGSWNSMDVGNNMKKYDVCIVPSKFDGWNLLINEAMRAHIGVIATDQAVSHELVENSGAGIVVKAGKPKAMAKAIEYAVENPGEVAEWKQKAKEYSPKISSESVGDYVIDVIKHECLGIGEERPVCPW